MNYVMAFIEKTDYDTVMQICSELGLPMALSWSARGTALQSMRDLLGIENTKKRVICAFASTEKTAEFIDQLKRRIYIGVPGHGLVAAIPVKSIGGGKMAEKLKGDAESVKYKPQINYDFEVIMAVANAGRTDMVMNAARSAGAAGGTVVHAGGTGAKGESRFMNISITGEREVIIIVTQAEKKAGIMRAILEKAGPGTDAGAVVFSLPVSDVAGFGLK